MGMMKLMIAETRKRIEETSLFRLEVNKKEKEREENQEYDRNMRSQRRLNGEESGNCK